MEYIGTIVEESLKDNRYLNNLGITNVRISNAENPSDRWHLYTVKISKSDIEKLAAQLKPQKWYMHFWSGDNVIAVFPNRIFEFKHSQKATWNDVIQHGLSLGIPLEQLDFIIE